MSSGWHHSEETKARMKEMRKGTLNSNWKGGVKMVDGYKYLWAPQHPHATKEGYVAEHRLVMEKCIGRFLGIKEVVHHIDGNKLNNKPENLMVLSSTGSHFIKMHLKGRDIFGRFLKWRA
jgi:hypothetical protein